MNQSLEHTPELSDNDGNLDLVTSNFGIVLGGVQMEPAGIFILIGNGDGSFQAPIGFPVGMSPGSVVVSDFNEDGNLDVASGDFSSMDVFVRLGHGDGSFQPAVTLTARSGPSIAVADVNNDQHADIVATSSVLLGNGDGTFQAARDFAEGLFFSFVRTDDLNSDGNIDVVAGSGQFNTIGVGLGNGDGSFQPLDLYVVGDGPTEVSIVDLDGNVAPDLIVSNFSDDHLSLLFNKGDGHFEAARSFLSGPDFTSSPSGVISGDFNSDGGKDLVVTNAFDPASMLMGNGDGSFGPPMALGVEGQTIAEGDFNQDGNRDLALTDRDANLSILLGNGDTTFVAPTETALMGGDAIADDIVASDLNNDTLTDLIVANTGTHNVSVFLGNGNGRFQAVIDAATGVHPRRLTVDDFNGDGSRDLAVANQGDLGVLNGSLSILIGNGDGTFQPANDLFGGTAVEGAVSGDFNADGNVDLAAIVQSPIFIWNISVLLGNGNGTFQAPANTPIPDDFFPNGALKASDIDMDGILDLIAVIDDSSIGILQGNGDGSFLTSVPFDVGAGPNDILITDLNTDTQPDLAITAAGGITILINASVIAPAPVDINGDGAENALDLVVQEQRSK